MNKLLSTSLVIFMCVVSVWAQGRGLRVQNSERQATERRVALVIGNGAYKDNPLVNPVNDARGMAQALAGFGFEIIYGENNTQNEMKKAINEFGSKIHDGGVGLFYFAGHGLQVNGRNYIIPVGANITSEAEVEYEAVDVGRVLVQMEEAKNPLNIVILDACRNNPFARSFRSPSRGLAAIDAPSGTLIAYATAPGSVSSDGEGSHGLYTGELLKAMQMPRLRIEDVFKRVRVAVKQQTGGKQIPWETSSLEGNFYFSIPVHTETNSRKETEQPAQAINSDFNNVQSIYSELKAETDCTKVRLLARRLTTYYLNTNPVPERVTNTVIFPDKKEKPTIGDLAKDRYLRIRKAKADCFTK